MFKVESATLHDHRTSRSRSYSATKTRIYFWPRGESIPENLENRRTRPYNEYRRLLPNVLQAVGVEDGKNLDIRWSQKAGCGCGCSPGFVVDGWNGVLHRKDVHVDVVMD